jgi:DNA-binding transcriptional ArsR family regulator
VIDRLRKEIEARLEQVLAEAEKLRKALSALDPRGQSSSTSAAKPRSRATRAGRQRPAASRTRHRTAPGATKARVLQALPDGKAMTAGEVATATGLARGTVSTTLSKLAKSGEVSKAQRGYRLPTSRTAGAAGEDS